MDFVTQLAIILIAAGVFTVISKALKQPLILGYIIAGFLVGPHLGLVPMSDTSTISQWAEIGIIFLLFALGLEFSFKKLLKVGSSALITAVVKCIGMFALGLIVGPLMGWSTMESIFLGGLMSMSSTTIIIKAYNDMGLKKRPYANLLFGSLVFEDLIAVLLMVLLSTMAKSNEFAGTEMVMALAKLGFFLILWFVVGIYVIPSLLKWAHKYINNEIILLIGIGFCFLMVALAQLAGFSSALGAFVMGSILAETVEGERIEHAIGSIKDLFGAIFFVSVGMMVDPQVIGQHWLPILILTVISMAGILIFSSTGSLLSGQGIKNSVHIGFSLAQLGEFAFIIAALGCGMGVMREFIYPVVVTVSVITTFTTPYMIKAADPVSDWLIRILPEKFVQKLEPKDEQVHDSQAEKNEWKHLLRMYFIRTLIFSILLTAIVVFSRQYLPTLIAYIAPSLQLITVQWISAIITLLFMLPLLYLMILGTDNEKKSVRMLLRNSLNNKWPIIALVYLKLLISIIFILLGLLTHVQMHWVIIAIVVIAIVALFFASRKSRYRFTHMEDRFVANLNEKEARDRANRPVTTSIEDKLADYHVLIDSTEIQPDFDFIGKTLREMPFRHTVNVNVVEIMRGDKVIRIPRGDEVIYPNDTLLVVGEKREIDKFHAIIEDNRTKVKVSDKKDFVVQTLVIKKGSNLAGKTIRNSDMRAYGCMIVSILHGNKFITNPQAEDIIEEGDTIWIAGEKDSCEFFL